MWKIIDSWSVIKHDFGCKNELDKIWQIWHNYNNCDKCDIMWLNICCRNKCHIIKTNVIECDVTLGVKMSLIFLLPVCYKYDNCDVVMSNIK